VSAVGVYASAVAVSAVLLVCLVFAAVVIVMGWHGKTI